ncbi:hypothetical protein [Sinorhizobium meliloti]|uniref:hypothetical protein n=1 Tax=Rhizobium meliloti TaxID=382 RepID=UPI00040EC6EB|nr:hypothetical protein [Sinorhizobium meliloti]MBP2468268.1 uncharacterized small protein (DUF1192 family) [Sinorhizobium meliloti]MDE3813690.1 hypothetical protein [Sinorhizobium meliloti]MDE3821968.1 hypothetical protein [Sinorhizobium meliloti]MDE4616342.1 Atg14 domain-containing protein [Sinorhizobium meliloti]QND36629.1 hypothetical protein HB772_34245 [Sinorhizobium meliloti]
MSTNKHGEPRPGADARPLDPPSVDEPIDAWGRDRKSAPEVGNQLDELRERIARLQAEIDAIATETHTAVGTVPGADRLETARDVVAEKRDEIKRLTARLEEIERTLGGSAA